MDPATRARELVIRGDNLIKQAGAGRAAQAALRRALACYREALDLARQEGLDALAAAAELHLRDLAPRVDEPPPATRAKVETDVDG